MDYSMNEMKSVRVFDPELAAEIGLNEAIVLGQIKYWVEKNEQAERNYHDGKYWVYNTFDQWKEQFPWWSVRTIKSAFLRLEKEGYIVSACYNKEGYDRTKWYSLGEKMSAKPAEKLIVQNLHDGLCKNCTMDSAEFARPIPKITTEITTETNEAGSTMVQPEDRAELAGRPCDSDSSDKISFEQIESLFGTELLEDMIDFVTDYTEQHYPRYRHTNHPPVSRASKAVYAYKLLLCALELSLRPDQVKDCLINALRKEKKYDPRINLVTRPKTLGVWLADAMTVDMNAIRESRYNWMTDVSEYELNPFDEKRRPIYEHCISRWKALVLGN